MTVITVLESSWLTGALAVRAGDSFSGRPLEYGYGTVTALRPSDRKSLAAAVLHTTGVQGFLTLRASSYYILVEPAAMAFLPSLRSVTIPLAPGEPIIMPVPLRTSPSYPALAGTIVARGTVLWNRTPKLPARWVSIFAKLLDATAGTTLASAWTRADGRGEFSVVITAPTPDADGNSNGMNLSVEVHGTPPPAGAVALPTGDRSDLPLDDGDDVGVLAREALQRTLTSSGVHPGDVVSINQDSFTVVPPGGGAPIPNKAILL
jgi:hypothetical protein